MEQINFTRFYKFDDGTGFKPMHFNGDKEIVINLYDDILKKWCILVLNLEEFFNRNPHVV